MADSGKSDPDKGDLGAAKDDATLAGQLFSGTRDASAPSAAPAPVDPAAAQQSADDAAEAARYARERSLQEASERYEKEDAEAAARDEQTRIAGCTPRILLALILAAVIGVAGTFVVFKNGDNNSTTATKCSSQSRRRDNLQLVACDKPAVVASTSNVSGVDTSPSVASSSTAAGAGPFAATYTGTFTGTNPTDQLCPMGAPIPATITITGQGDSNAIGFTLDARSKDGSIHITDVQSMVGSDGSFQGTSPEGVAISAHFTLDGSGNAATIDHGVVANPSCNATFEGTRSG